VNRHREILENELETVGLRLNKSPPNITLTMKKTGGVRITKVKKKKSNRQQGMLVVAVIVFVAPPKVKENKPVYRGPCNHS
jgi:ribosome-interacting GTPase 1